VGNFIGALAVGGVIARKANGILGTWRTQCTRIDATVFNAGAIQWTLAIVVTFDSLTTHQRIALKTWQTTAGGAMVVAIALGIQGAWIFQGARVQALAVATHFVVGTLTVGLASQFDAAVLRVARIAWFAAADGVMVLDETFGIFSTVARIDTPLVEAGLGARAL
jgi:hypothetical protein